MIISIITPNRNGAEYIEKTLSSILDQQGCKIELIVVDGASSDNSMDVIRRFENRLAFCISEPDKGMYDAINKGMRLARGDILAYLNSDDFYYPGTLEFVAKYFQDNPVVDLVYGDLNFVDSNNRVIFKQNYPSFNKSRFRSMHYSMIGQPGSFWRRSLWEKVGEFDTSLKMASDFDFYIRAGESGRIAHVQKTLAAFRVHDKSMTQRQAEVSGAEVEELHRRYLKNQSRIQNFYSRTIGNINFKLINVVNIHKRISSLINKR